MSNQRIVKNQPTQPKKSSGSIGSAIDKILTIIRTELENPTDQVTVLNTVVHALALKGTIVRGFQPAPEEALISTIQRLGVASPFQRLQTQAPKYQQDVGKASSTSKPTNAGKAKAGDARPTNTSQKRERNTIPFAAQPVPLLERRMSPEERVELVNCIKREKELSAIVGRKYNALKEKFSQSKQTGPKPSLDPNDEDVVSLKGVRQWISEFRKTSKGYPRDSTLSQVGGQQVAPTTSGESEAKRARTDVRQPGETDMEGVLD